MNDARDRFMDDRWYRLRCMAMERMRRDLHDVANDGDRWAAFTAYTRQIDTIERLESSTRVHECAGGEVAWESLVADVFGHGAAEE